MVVSITTTFPSVPQVSSALSKAARLHLLYYWVAMRRYSPSLVAQLATTVPEPGRKHTERLYDDREDS
jgi:hypothetical protein